MKIFFKSQTFFANCSQKLKYSSFLLQLHQQFHHLFTLHGQFVDRTFFGSTFSYFLRTCNFVRFSCLQRSGNRMVQNSCQYENGSFLLETEGYPPLVLISLFLRASLQIVFLIGEGHGIMHSVVYSCSTLC